MTGPNYDEKDPGVDIEGWSEMVVGTSVPVDGGGSVVNQSGWAQITTTNTAKNGGLKFILAATGKHIHYDNNGFLGVQIPDQYAAVGATTLTVEEDRLKHAYEFDGWNTKADGSGTTIAAGTVLTIGSLPEGVSWIGDTVINLYAQAHYDGTLQIALSFINPADSKRYFLTHPNSSAPRYARARHFEHWENTWQGMENAENQNPNYISTFELRHPANEIRYKDEGTPDMLPSEKVLDPRQQTMHGYEDSLVFYEYFAPARDEYLGLYYQTPNTILANNTWAGLFTTTSGLTSTGWPDYITPYIPSAKLKSERYVEEYDPTKPDSLILKVRSNHDKPYVKYDPATNQFDGVANEEDATEFELTAISVADAHYIILPDTSEAWRDTIEFGFHEAEQTKEVVWSKLIGKQLLAAMMVDRDTVYFHPNRNKIINDPNELYLSQDFRVTQTFSLIPDSRATSVAAEDRVSREETANYWCYNIVSGQSSPMNVKDKSGNYIDVVDTFRIELSQGSISKIKEYRGRWKKGARGLHVRSNGSRYHDVIVRTKTYHYGDTLTQLVLQPEEESYSFNPLAGNTQQLNFRLLKVRSHKLYDARNNLIREDWIETDTVTGELRLGPGVCSFSSGATSPYFAVVDASTTDNYVTLRTKDENKNDNNYDTLIVATSVTINGKAYDATARVPLVQTPLLVDELVWSFVHSDKKRYFIVAGTDGIKLREFTEQNSTLYKKNTKTHLKKGAATAANNDEQYITPWAFGYRDDVNQLWLKTEYGVNKYFGLNGGEPAAVDGQTMWTFRYANEVYTDAEGHEEEQVRLKYGPGQWLAYNGRAFVLQADSTSATIFSWSYLKSQRYLLNNGTYPSRTTATFEYNTAATVNIQTRYKAYKDSAMLLNHKLVNLCREDENDIANLINAGGEWKTDTTITLIRDARSFDGGAKSSGLSRTTNASTLTTSITSTATSPTNVKIGGKYVDIVDTLDFQITLRTGAPDYKFQDAWSSYSSVEDAHVKVPLLRRTYHSDSFDSLICTVAKDQQNLSFPATISEGENDTIKYLLSTIRRKGTQVLNTDNEVAAMIGYTSENRTRDRDKSNVGMHLNSITLAEVRLADEYGNTPGWCKIKAKGDSTVTVQCLQNGVRSPRYAYLYFAYIITINDTMRFVNHRMTISQAGLFSHNALQTLRHTNGASGDEMMADGRQQVHENKRILYYYPDEEVELPVRERAFYGWWRWYREGIDEKDSLVSDYDVPDSLWITPPQNKGKYSYPFTPIIVDSILIDPKHPEKGKKRGRSMGRFTVFHYKSRDYANKNDPPAKNPVIAPP